MNNLLKSFLLALTGGVALFLFGLALSAMIDILPRSLALPSIIITAFCMAWYGIYQIVRRG